MDGSTNKSGMETEKKEERHHHHHSHRRKPKSKFAKFVKKHKSVMINGVVIVLALAAVITMGIWADAKRDLEGVSASANGPAVIPGAEDATSVHIEVPFFAKEAILITGPAAAYMKENISVPATTFLDPHRLDGVRLDAGLPVELAFEVSGLPVEYTVEYSVIEVSERPDLKMPRVYTLKSNERSVKVYHLKTNTQYYYRISIELSNDLTQVVQGSFKTADTPRVLSIDGAVNVRDIGSWKTTDGYTVRQGLLYRGSELDGAVEARFSITEKGRNDMLTVLGICTDLDLRSPADNTYGTDALGANVKHVYFDVPMYSGVFETPEKVRAVFGALADPNNYPVYLHCTYGMDRTGTFCYLLEALLGVDEEDLMRDYQLTALYYNRLNIDEMNAFVAALDKLEGETMQEKVEGYLLSVGVTEEEIASIKDIFLE